MKYFLIVLLSLFFTISTQAANVTNSTSNKMLFWQTQAKGANIFNQKIDRDVIKAAKKYGISFIRLAPDKFISKKRDFLIGNADQYNGLVKEDLNVLKEVVNMCHREGIPVVLTMLSLPGCRWKQNNNNVEDLRLWKDQHFLTQATNFWQDLAREFKDHPAIIGYDILNEPHPERVYGPQGSEQRDKNNAHIRSTLQGFYRTIIEAIREVDPSTPIIIESSNNADAGKFNFLDPFLDDHILYSFHFYEPYCYTNFKINQGNFGYPGLVPDDDDKATPRFWDKAKLKELLKPVVDFQKKHNVPNHQILVGEFGGHRSSKGLEHYFSDLISIFNKEGWHFAVYAFQEDTWDGMDYELGCKKLPWSYWKELEEGKKPQIVRLPENPVFKVLTKEWGAQNKLNKKDAPS